VAGVELTRSAIHRIENGQSRPSLRSLSLIAQRTGKPLSFFLSSEPAPVTAELELERLAAEARFEELVARGRELLARATLSDHVRAGVNYWLGLAQVRMTQPEAALEHLEVALAALAKLGDPWLVAHALHMKASALYLLDDPESQFVAEEALRRCRELEPAEPMLEARVLNHLAAIAINREDWQSAVRLYDRALAAAEPLRDLRQLSLMYEGLAMAYHHLGHATRAADLFSRALGLYSLQSDLSSMARAEVNLSQLLLEQGLLGSAEQHLETSLRYCDDHGVDRKNRTYATAGMARLRLRQGRDAEADSLAGTAIELGEARDERLSVATALQVRGQLKLRAGLVAEGEECFERAIELFGTLNLLERLRLCRIEFATELDALDLPAAAKEQWKLAALVGRGASRSVAERLSAQA
jgi:tetratricopeptide (TPR) repeat protein